jgi:spore germination cell wall hydrolase CwlJ-like protein
MYIHYDIHIIGGNIMRKKELMQYLIAGISTLVIGTILTSMGSIPDVPHEEPHEVAVERDRQEYLVQESLKSTEIVRKTIETETETTEPTEPIITAEETTKSEPNPAPYSDYEIALLERVVMSEASIEPYECKVAVCETILNRCDMYNSNIEDVVYSPNQYSMADNGYPTDEVRLAVQQAISYRISPSNMIYFRQDYYHSFGEPYTRYGDMYFSLAN